MAVVRGATWLRKLSMCLATEVGSSEIGTWFEAGEPPVESAWRGG